MGDVYLPFDLADSDITRPRWELAILGKFDMVYCKCTDQWHCLDRSDSIHFVDLPETFCPAGKKLAPTAETGSDAVCSSHE